MQRRAIAYENGECVGEITCEEYGHTLESKRVWWVPDTKKKYLFHDVEEYVCGGEAMNLRVSANANLVAVADSNKGVPQPVTGELENLSQPTTGVATSHFELYTGPVIHGGGFSF